MKKATILSLVIAMLIFAGCTSSGNNNERIEKNVYYGAIFEYKTNDKIEYKIIHRQEDVLNLISNFNSFAMEESNAQMEEWIYRITFVKSFETADDKQSLAFSPDEEDLTVLVSENKIQLGQQLYELSGTQYEIIKFKYDCWDYYDVIHESIH